ncbi:XdhC family protein [Maribacter algicola]|uniref:XdhC family protein n=1 Tax=Meishania litoralis TaxID=3434685 RepID=A0ACC7LJ96_9FLAO
MTHELKNIINAFKIAQEEGLKTILATVVALNGSSYREPGVRMLIREDGKMIGAVSGGCVEKEVLRQAQSVFQDGTAKVMTYDGRYRLGCEGILYILLEPFDPSQRFIANFESVLKKRINFEVISYFLSEDASNSDFGSVIKLDGQPFYLRDGFKENSALQLFKEEMPPLFKLMIIGSEHDAVQLCGYAALTGWEVTIATVASEEKTVSDFPGAVDFISGLPEELDVTAVDDQTAVILMTHSYVKDLKYLLRLKGTNAVYLGILGPSARREKLLNEFLERCPEVSDTFFDRIHGPSGLNIGAETPQEIAISIISEILAVTRGQDPMPLKDKSGTIHST